MKVNNLERKITALFLFGALLINIYCVIPEVINNDKIMSVDLKPAYGMPTSILGTLYMANIILLAGILYCLLNLDDTFKIFRKDERALK